MPELAALSSDSGPNDSPPSLPPGWIAQWDGNARRYYFVQISTGVSTWDIPTEPAPGVPSPGTTPMPTENQFQPPQEQLYNSDREGTTSRGIGGAQEGDRGLGSVAMNMLMNKQGAQNSSGLGGLAQSLLGGTHSQQQGSNSASAGFVGQISNLLGSNKPYGQQGSQGSYGTGQQQQYGENSSGIQQGVGGFLGSLLGGHGSGQQQNYGYSSSGQLSGGYAGNAPPAAYNPSGAAQQSFGPSSAPYNPSSYSNHASQPQSQYGRPPNGGSGTPYHNGQMQQQYGQQFGGSGGYANHQHNQYPQQAGQGGYGGGYQSQYGGGYGQEAPPYDQGYPPPPPMNSHPGNQSGYGGQGGYGGPPGPQPPQWR